MKHLNFLWTVLDTTQLECDKERLQRLKDKNNAPKLSEEDAYIISHVRKIDDDAYFNSLEGNSHGGDSSNESMDFHDYIFAEEVPVETFLVTDDNEEIVIVHDEEMEEDLPLHPQHPPLSPPPLRILQHNNHPPKLKLIDKQKSTIPSKKQSFGIQKFIDTDDSDMHFLKSILPFLAQLSPQSRKRTHKHIKRIIMQEFEQKSFTNDDQDEIKIKHEPVEQDEQDGGEISEGYQPLVLECEISEEVKIELEA